MNLKTVRDMARIYIKTEFVDQNLIPSRHEMELAVKRTADFCKLDLSDKDLKIVLDEISMVFSVEIEGSTPILSNNEDHEEWLSVTRSKISWKFWNRYEKYLEEEKGIPEKSIKSINRTTDKILALLENPSRDGQWDRRGLVVGSVQSGKTGNYTGLICKAADAGYKVIIVLAGIHNDLRAQSQLRLDEGFLGYETNIDGANKRKLIGVGTIDPTPKANTITNRSENGDFNRRSAGQFNIEPEQIPLLFVVKKNKSILENLNSWVATFADGGTEKVKETSLLVIDDEADQASVDVKEEDPSTINKLIRKLLNSFEKSAYVGYTATPFANVLINDTTEHEELGEDLFPKSFIISLPVPDNYVGPQKIFSVEADEKYPIIKNLTDDIDNSTEWIPRSHKRDLVPRYHGDEKIPPCLERAICSFILSVAIRDLRGDNSKHNSMLVHVTRFTEVQEKVSEQILDYVDEIRARIGFEQDSSISIMGEIKKIFDLDYKPTSMAIGSEITCTWDEIKEQIVLVMEKLEVKTINGTSSDGLEYLRVDFPECVIAIGGDKLSRGLTLEGLSVSYFLRQSRMYDTLMQMGRWFGYRPRYDDLCRLFTNTSLVSNFQSILLASEELIEELNQMSLLKMSPKDFGLKVKVSPGLLVTNRLKMRDTMEVDVSFATGVAESTSLATSDITKNWKNLNSFLSICDKSKFQDSKMINSKQLNRTWSNILYYSDVKGLDVANFLMEFKTHESSRAVIPEILGRYISEQLKINELINWTVVVHSGSGEDIQFENSKTVKKSQRKVLNHDTDKISFRRLASKNDEFLDMDKEKIEHFFSVLEEPQAEKIKDVQSRIMRNKENGLLMFYIIHPLDRNNNTIETESPLVGFMISFPRSVSAQSVRYRVNSVWVEENMS